MNKVQTFFANNRTCLLLFVGILIVYGLSYNQRQSDYDNFWMENPQDYFVEDVTVLTNADGYYWLKMARELDKGTIGIGQSDPTKGYPDLHQFALKDTPSLLAVLISFAKKFTDGDYYRAGIFLVPILSGLFIFPLFFYFRRLGFGAAAILGGLIGTFGHAYYDRTMMGRVDTDLLITFFPLAIGCFILLIGREKSWRANLLLAAAAGLTMYLFNWWYQQPSFILIYFLVLTGYLLFSRVRWKVSLAVLATFLLMSGPEYVSQTLESVRIFFMAYMSPPPTGLISWPNILDTVVEAEVLSVAKKLQLLHGFSPMVYAGLVGLCYLCLRRFRQMIPLAPLLVIGAWSMVGPNRFVMYWSPLIGIGVGVLLEELLRYGGGRVNLQKGLRPVVSMLLGFILFFSTANYTGYYVHAGSIIPSAVIKAMLDIKRLVPENSAMFTPFWEYGYALMQVGDFATYHDGGLQGGMRTTLAAKAMTSSRQKEMVSLLSYLEDHGFNQLSSRVWREKLSGDQLEELVLSYPEEFKGENVYILYLEDMIVKFPSMSLFGAWDFDKKRSEKLDYVELKCFSMDSNIIRCADGTIDLNRGVMNDGAVDVPLSGAIFVNDGQIVEQKYYPAKDGYYLQVLMKKGRAYLTLVANESLFKTNFNQQFLLGNFDPRYFEEVYNDFPTARLFKVKGPEAAVIP